MLEGYTMNPVVTSKEAILLACRTIAAGQGLSALSMRTVAKECGIALGTMYNYFPDKDTLLLATVESVWKDIFHRSNPCGTPLLFPDYAADLFRGILDGAAKYPNFLTAHSLAIAGSKKGEAKSSMEQCFVHMKAGLLAALKADPMVDSAAFSGDLTESAFVDFVMDTFLLQLVKESPNPEVLSALIRRVIYR